MKNDRELLLYLFIPICPFLAVANFINLYYLMIKSLVMVLEKKLQQFVKKVG